jgi:hypothetical protein
VHSSINSAPITKLRSTAAWSVSIQGLDPTSVQVVFVGLIPA